MPHDYRSQSYRPYGARPQSTQREERDYWERGQMRRGGNREPYDMGDERRYLSDRDERFRRAGFEGERRPYPAGGYPEEFGYRREARWNEDRANQERGRLRGGAGSYEEFSRMWKNEDEQGPDYYGTGSHYGAGFGTAPSSRTSAAGSWGAPGFAGQGAWSDPDDWMPEDERGLSGSYESYGRSTYGAQSGYGRDYETAHSPTQSFRGRGPKGYERSDERLKEMICERLSDDPRIDASDVSVEVTQRLVKLTGTVAERRTKYQIEDLIERCGGVKDIDNQLRVQGNQPWTTAQSSNTGASAAVTGAKGTEGRSAGSPSPATKRS